MFHKYRLGAASICRKITTAIDLSELFPDPVTHLDRMKPTLNLVKPGYGKFVIPMYRNVVFPPTLEMADQASLGAMARSAP